MDPITLRKHLQTIVEVDIPQFSANIRPTPLPIIDMTEASAQAVDASNINIPTDLSRSSVEGLRKFLGDLTREIEALGKTRPDSAQKPLSTNSPYLLAVWAEVLSSTNVIAVCKSYPLVEYEKGGPHFRRGRSSRHLSKVVKVDVVSDNGERWTRLSTITSDRLLRELYELDLTGSANSDSSNSVDRGGFSSERSKLFQAGLDLRDAARAEAHPPSEICMRFTRLLPHVGASELLDVETSTSNPSKNDQLIVAQLRRLRELGIRVKLGPSPLIPVQRLIPSAPAPQSKLIPTRNINLDLSLLLALCSDITHAPLPASEDDALRRFHTLSWRQRRGTNRGGGCVGEMDTAPDPDSKVSLEPPGSCLSPHARSLASQAMQESRSGLMDRIRDRCYPDASYVTHFDSSARESSPSDHQNRYRFWTTREAKDRFLAIVDKIGGPMEKLRARALFQKQLEADFWESSRYPMKYIPDLIPIHPLEDPTAPIGSKPPSILDLSPSPLQGPTSPERLDRQLEFRARLRETCLDLLSLKTSPALASVYPASQIYVGAHASPHSSTPKLIPASALKIGLSARNRITPHTLRSLLVGVGVDDTSTMMTTLTANRSSIDAVLSRTNALFPAPFPSPALTVHTQETINCITPRSQTVDPGLISVQHAVVWIVEPRSLAEDMRSDSGDVSVIQPSCR